jgi:hypothetical protein
MASIFAQVFSSMSEVKEPLPRRTKWPVKTEGKPDEDAVPKGPKPTLMMPTSAEAVFNNLVCREVIDPSAPLEPASQTIKLLRDTVEAIAAGNEIKPFKEYLQRVSTNQPEKADLIISQLNQINDERIPGLVEMVDHSERMIRRAAMRNDMTVGEALVVWREARSELTNVRKTKEVNQQKAVDSVTVVEKIDVAHQTIERSVQQKWEYTSPMGREVIRKKVWELKKAEQARQVAEKATVTVESTVEKVPEPVA